MIQIIDISPDMCDVRGDTQANVWNGGTALVHEGGNALVYEGGTALVHEGGYAWVYKGGSAYIHNGASAEGPGEIVREEANDESN